MSRLSFARASLAVWALSACDQSPTIGIRHDLAGPVRDMATTMPQPGVEAGVPDYDAANQCGDFDPTCTVVSNGPTGNPSMPFPLPSDNPPPSGVGADGVSRDPTGALVLDSSHANFDYLWIADDMQYGVGLVSKVSTKPRTPPANAHAPGNGKYPEVARYLTVTCYSDSDKNNWPTDAERAALQVGMTQTAVCNGKTQGCCDSAPAGKRGPIQLIRNRPSRTAVDFNGDMWVSNRAHDAAPNQSSVTKIANNLADCIDRNGNSKIDTSFDANNDGIIDTDCNENNFPDDFLDLDPSRGGPCKNGKMQEFFGLDDECILFTTNTGPEGGTGRPLTLGKGSNGDFGPADAWAGRYNDGFFYRVDGKTGNIITTVNWNGGVDDPLMPGTKVMPAPYGASIDQFGILWTPDIYSVRLFYFDTADPNNPAKQAAASPPTSIAPDPTNLDFYGISLDGFTLKPDPNSPAQLVQQIWLAHYGAAGAWRYRPNRGGTFADLGKGEWARIDFAGAAGNGRGIAVDNRSPVSYAWVGLDSNPGAVGRIPIAIDGGASVLNTVYTGNGVTTLGVGVANDLDIWAVNQGDSSLTHFTVGASADLTAADKIDLNDNTRLAPAIQPNPYTYSDFTGFGLRNFTNPHGYYQWTQQGCFNGMMGKTRWLKVVWDGDTPGLTAITLKARSADDQASLATQPWSTVWTMSPADLQNPPPGLMPNPSGYLQIEFDLTTMDKNTTPKLKGFQILYECITGVG